MSLANFHTLAMFFIICHPLGQLQAMQDIMQKLDCEMLDKEFGTFKECSVRKVGHVSKVNVHFIMNHANVSNITINGVLYRKERAYKPFLYNDTIDFCEYLRTAQRHIFWNFAYDQIKKYSNINHTCPYNHDLIVKDFAVQGNVIKMVPLPRGLYMVKVAAYGVLRSQVTVYIHRK